MTIINKVPYKPAKPYCWKTKDVKGKLTNYSERFKTILEAIMWYINFGMALEFRFNRKLELVKNVQIKPEKNAA